MKALTSLGGYIYYIYIYIYSFSAFNSVETSSFPSGTPALLAPKPSQCCDCEITLSHTIVGRNLLDEWSTRRGDFYLTTHNTHNIRTSTPHAGFEHTNPGSDRTQTHALDRGFSGDRTGTEKGAAG